MTTSCPAFYPYQHPSNGGLPFIEVHDHDILCGRGVPIAQHPGNERFRALVNSRHDESYCTAYTTSEKKAVAEEILKHIKSLDPPGRFLKRSKNCSNSRDLTGPWEQLPDREAIKKTCQALRDCNRSDRTGYANAVVVPEDVKKNVEERINFGLSNKELAAAAVAAVSQRSNTRSDDLLSPAANNTTPRNTTLKRNRTNEGNEELLSSGDNNISRSVSSALLSLATSENTTTTTGVLVSPSVETTTGEQAWSKKQKTDNNGSGIISNITTPNVSTNDTTSDLAPPFVVQTTASFENDTTQTNSAQQTIISPCTVTRSPNIMPEPIIGFHNNMNLPSSKDPPLSSFATNFAGGGALSSGCYRSITPNLSSTSTTSSPHEMYNQRHQAVAISTNPQQGNSGNLGSNNVDELEFALSPRPLPPSREQNPFYNFQQL